VFVDDVDSCHDDAARRGADIVEPWLTGRYGMRDFNVRTPDGSLGILATAYRSTG